MRAQRPLQSTRLNSNPLSNATLRPKHHFRIDETRNSITRVPHTSEKLLTPRMSVLLWSRLLTDSEFDYGPLGPLAEIARPAEGTEAASAGTRGAVAGAAAPALDAGTPDAEAEAAAATGRYALAGLEDAAERANHYASNSKSEATIRAYAAGWRDFLAFCQLHGAEPLPATEPTVAAYLAALADRGAKAATIARRLVVIAQAHKAANLPTPTGGSLVRRTHAGIRHTIGTAQTGKAPAVVEDLKRMLMNVPSTRVGLRDRALLLLGFAGGFRRSELVD